MLQTIYIDKANVFSGGLFRTICASPILGWYIIRFFRSVIGVLANYPCQKPKIKERFNNFYLYIDIFITPLS